MSARRLGLALAAAIWLLAPPAGAAEPLPPTKQASTEPAAPARILVMIRLAPEHYRPGADYAGGGYGDDIAQAGRRRVAARIARDHALALVDSWPMPLIGVDCFVMAVPSDRAADAVAAAVGRDAAVAWSEALGVYRANAAIVRPDPMFLAQPAARRWRLAALHRRATGRGVTVAVIDSKVARSHPDLAGQLAASANFVSGSEPAEEAHGTAVAGIIAARAGNGLGIAGVAPAARLMGLRACRETRTAAGAVTLCDGLSLAKALHFAIERRAQVVNMSLGGPPNRLLAQLIALGISRGATMVAAYDPALAAGGFPASQPGVIAVAADEPSSPSGRVHVAPGHDVPTTEPGGRWTLVNGSSYAAAHVSGLVALIREHHAAAGAVALVSGAGGIDACATLARASDPGERVCAPQAPVVASR